MDLLKMRFEVHLVRNSRNAQPRPFRDSSLLVVVARRPLTQERRQPDDLRYGREHPGLQQSEAILGKVPQALAARIHDLGKGPPLVPEIR